MFLSIAHEELADGNSSFAWLRILRSPLQKFSKKFKESSKQEVAPSHVKKTP